MEQTDHDLQKELPDESGEDIIVDPTIFDSWHQKDRKHAQNGRLTSDANFDGPSSARKWTDIAFLIIFLVCNLGFAAALAYVFNEGDFERLQHWYDFRGELCGVDGLSGKEYAYWPEPDVSMDLAICLPGCPGNTAVGGICLYETDHETETDTCYTSYPSKPFNKMCIPASTDVREEVTEKLFQDVDVVVWRIMGDILKAWDLIALGLCISFALALMFLIFFRFPSTMQYVVLVCCILAISFIGLLAYLVYEEADRVYELINDDHDKVDMEGTDDNVDSGVYRILCYVICAIGAVLILATMILLFSVKRTFEILRLSARPLKNIPMLLLVPLVELFIGALFVIALAASSMATVTVGNIDERDYDGDIPGGDVKVIHYHTKTRVLLMFIIPMCLWWMSIIATSGEYIVNSAAAVWFFSKDKQILDSPILRGFKHLVGYHLGSVILGSIIVPMFRIPKAVLGWAKGRLSKGRGCCTRCCGGTLICCFASYENFIRYLSGDAFAFMALWGDSFTKSSQKAYFLKSRSGHNIKELSTAGSFTIWIFQIVISLVTPVFVMYWVVFEKKTFAGELTEQITSAVAPAFFALIVSAFMAQIFGGVFRGCVHSAIICFLADHEMFVDMQGFADQDMAAYFTSRKAAMMKGGKSGKTGLHSGQDLNEGSQGDVERSVEDSEPVPMGGAHPTPMPGNYPTANKPSTYKVAPSDPMSRGNTVVAAPQDMPTVPRSEKRNPTGAMADVLRQQKENEEKNDLF